MSPRMRRYADLAMAVVLGLGWAIGTSRYALGPLVAVGAGAAVGLALAVRRRLPLASYVVVLGVFAATVTSAPAFVDHAGIAIVVFLLNLYSLGAHARGIEARLGVVGVLAAVLVVTLVDGDVYLGGVFFYTMLCGVPWAAGLALRLRVDRVRDLAARNAAVAAEAERVLAEERARIARELHDVVAHAIAVTVLQARGAAKQVGRDDRSVRDALAAIEQTNVAALADMRRLLTVLRRQDDTTGRDEPAPTLDRLDRLVDQVRASGLPVELRVTGDPLPVSPGLDLSAYRIVQEALTNVLRHGGPHARARVEVHYDASDLSVRVVNRGVVPPRAGSTGHGLVGIRERVVSAGGTLDAGPRDGGYAVHATMPYLVAT